MYEYCNVSTCHHAGPGIKKRKKFRALQTIERVFPGAKGTLNEQIQTSHVVFPKNALFTGISILLSISKRDYTEEETEFIEQGKDSKSLHKIKHRITRPH